MTPVDYHGQTTLITGASAGIGAEFARQLAARGSDVVLVARRLDRLEHLADELATTYRITATPIAMDLATPGVAAALDTALTRRGLTVTGLINNAGFATNAPFHQEDPQRLEAEIAVNVTTLVALSRVFIERLRAHGGGVLVNVASMAAYQATPTMAVYGATKAFVLSFTEALWYESRGTGLRVMALSPGATETEFFDVAGAQADGGTSRMRPDEVVTIALKALDRRTPPPSVITGTRNRLMAQAGRLVSRRRMAMTIGSMMDQAGTGH
ncbi:SDR family NAD(P)-dependent oxidoreductase [Nonomuraea rhodomycinica]|uniref:SDR family oxidoreductase n=1 Tax=Nonomuraea rhodomycinica TaxID=1712872 RepID=A0A7Y6IXU3_9ACTN|nr:SDR family oxidoreductase [Nonomuraea rhodomycinica]NUW46026.1 SDR family oxidoreductase [Nonomuraea rhodomycinica]